MHAGRDPEHAGQTGYLLGKRKLRCFYSQMFLVPKKDGRHRLVINLKRLNQSVKTEHFTMEGIHC